MTTVTNLPHWDMSVVYPSLESPEFQTGFTRVTQDIAELAQLFDACHVEKQEHLATDDVTIKNFEADRSTSGWIGTVCRSGEVPSLNVSASNWKAILKGDYECRKP